MNCKQCGKEFTGRADAKYCSSSCRVTANRNNLSVTDVTNVTDNHVTVNAVIMDFTEADRTGPNPCLNYGPHMDADELDAYKHNHNLPKYHNRVP